MRIPPLLFLLLLCVGAAAHPGTGIVRDSKGNLYYTDLQQVWKVHPDGRKTIAVAGVHTHELYIDAGDTLYGQHSLYTGEATNTYLHAIWKLRPDGKLDTVKGTTPGFFIENYSFTRDRWGNMYWVRQWKDGVFMKTSPQNKTTELARGHFNRVQWMHAIDSTLYFVRGDTVYQLSPSGSVRPFAPDLCRSNNGSGLFGLWSDAQRRLYVANTCERSVQRIAGTITETVYTAPEGWIVTGGTFDGQGRLWVLEVDGNNAVRVVNTGENRQQIQAKGLSFPKWVLAGSIAGTLVLVVLMVGHILAMRSK